jgi:hypothetical protein
MTSNSLDRKISLLLIIEVNSFLKNGKAAGIDDFVNEYFKYSSPQLVNIYCKLFNLAVNSGIVPETWLNGIN